MDRYTNNSGTDATQKWAELLNCPGFHASIDGEIRNPKGKILSQWREADNGAYRVRIKGRNRMVRWLVLTAFTGLPPCEGYYPRHRNRDRSDNSLENLVWAGKPSTTE